MLAALDRELGLEAPDPAKRAEELRGQIQEELKLCLQFKQAGDKNTALKHLQKKKALEKELEEHMLLNPEAEQQQVAQAQPR